MAVANESAAAFHAVIHAKSVDIEKKTQKPLKPLNPKSHKTDLRVFTQNCAKLLKTPKIA